MSTVTETWRPIPGYEGHYEVSDLGRVYSVRRVITNSLGHPNTVGGRYPSTRSDVGGYRIVRLSLNGHSRGWRVHALVLMAFVGPRPDRADINHKNGIKTDNRLANLEYATRSENMLHAYKSGLRKCCKGVNASRALLTEEQVRYVRGMKGVRLQAELADELNVSVGCIANIWVGRNWTHLP